MSQTTGQEEKNFFIPLYTKRGKLTLPRNRYRRGFVQQHPDPVRSSCSRPSSDERVARDNNSQPRRTNCRWRGRRVGGRTGIDSRKSRPEVLEKSRSSGRDSRGERFTLFILSFFLFPRALKLRLFRKRGRFSRALTMEKIVTLILVYFSFYLLLLFFFFQTNSERQNKSR